MEIGAAGTVPPIADLPLPKGGPAGAGAIPGGGVVSPDVAGVHETGIHEDSVGTLLQLLSTPQIHDLLNSVDAHRSHGVAPAPDTQLQAAVAALADRDVARALVHVAQYVKENPAEADRLAANASLSPIQAPVQELVRHITHEAKIEAERAIGAATVVVSAAKEHPQAMNGPDVLALAQRFAETGQLFNYIRASDLSQTVITAYLGITPEARSSALRRQFPGWMKTIWRRAPLLVLFVAWFTLGMVAAAIWLLARVAGVDLVGPDSVQAAFESWGLGFLGLVVLQFYIRVRAGGRRRF